MTQMTQMTQNTHRGMCGTFGYTGMQRMACLQWKRSYRWRNIKGGRLYAQPSPIHKLFERAQGADHIGRVLPGQVGQRLLQLLLAGKGR